MSPPGPAGREGPARQARQPSQHGPASMTALFRSVSHRPPAPWGLILLGALASFLGFANPLLRVPPAILAWPLVLALLARRAPSGRAALYHGWLCGALAASASLYWIALPVHDYGYLPWVLAVPCPLLMGAVLGGYPALFCWALRTVGGRFGPLALGLFAGLAWTGLETARGWLFSGFPWLQLAGAFAPWPAAIQGLALMGAYAFSGLVAACGVWLAGPGWRPRLAACAVVGLAAAYGPWALERPLPEEGRFAAAMIQGNVDQARKWDEESLGRTLGEYETLTRSVLGTRPEVVLWPETALTFFPEEPSPQSDRVLRFARETGVPLVTGAPGFDRARGKLRIYNRAFLITDKGLESHYDKEHLVPFGEYAPFGEDIPLLSSLLQGVGGFTPGRTTAPLRSGRLAMGMLICYESIFPELAQERVANGANVLVNISNDAWFGRSAAPRQHLELATLRAVEQGRYLLRATNTGYTALLDPRGRVSGETALFQEAAAAVSGVGLITATTLYHRLYGLIEGAALAAALVMLVWAMVTRPRDGQTSTWHCCNTPN
ncbi:Apolipoprotein N-acyltransferase [Fundidesulfovibrio magnetotacticus]|uniref:Apolipoprotein N-acyltransferase n=1 Tax=Fundidesulfovibrio magnetotacticus TaxID=2730080 RepID=A0A6V8M427_9BACT|nr:apolipoprotein N-acyltransferase [Fundidesulfovibrio magnetotacticus]GFK95155.1 Apolipoprotein N-acyltransferase [Fundidesulfovibrio magnetotacticus]